MKKRIICCILSALMIVSLMPASVFATTVKAVLSPQKLEVDGRLVECEKYNINGSNYFKLRDIAKLLNGTGSQFEVGFDSASNIITITTGASYTAVGGELAVRGDYSSTTVPSSQTIKINGSFVSNLTVYNIAGNNFFKLRELGDNLGFLVDYDASTNKAIVKSGAYIQPAITPGKSNYAVAMITDYGSITDESYNQATYEGCKEFCEANGIKLQYYRPTGDSDSERTAMIDAAVADGYNVIVAPNYSFAGALARTVNSYPKVHFIALDVSEGDYSGAGLKSLPSNLFSAVYAEEIAGYLAGYAAINLGYRYVGFLGGMAVPAIARYGYGFVQGVDDAAAELGLRNVVCEYAYANQFFGDSDITAVMNNWYQKKGVEVVFACGGGVYTSVAEAAATVNGKIIGVDVNQAPTIDRYGAGMTITSAMKGLSATVKTLLTELILNDNWSAYGGSIATLGLVSRTNPEANYVQLPYQATRWNSDFTQADYINLVEKIYSGSVYVSNSINVSPSFYANVIALNDYGNIK